MHPNLRRALALLVVILPAGALRGIGEPSCVDFVPTGSDFPLVAGGRAAALCADEHDWGGVLRAMGDFQEDVARVSSAKPGIEYAPIGRDIVLVGTLGRSRLVDALVREGRLDVRAIAGKWECHVRTVVAHPFPGVDRALVIAGSDQRGTIYGIYGLSEQIGVSPWYWWADVPVRRHAEIFVRPDRSVTGEPAVKYRGIFLNDEDPALSGWANARYGGLNHEFYSRVFELILRLGGNYLWPAMWHNCFSEDDPLNPKTADEYGIVMGTSHAEPMMRADQEWSRLGYTSAQWNFQTNAPALIRFWTAGIERNKPYENIVTIGMRGRGDSPMSPTANIALLEKIVAAQRGILAAHLDPDVTKVPQLWCLYKEVQGYYEKGMRVPDDVTLLWSDDNWGNLRRLPTPAERRRSGGAGVYYHFDYVGSPRSYKWLNTYPISKVWEQMNLAYHYGANRIWIVNVGDLKPMEFPIEFFLDLARRPERWTGDRLGEFGRLWAAREFGPEHASEIADLIAGYTKFNGRRKPELLSPDTYSLVDYREADTVVRQFDALADRARRIEAELPPEYRDAFYELVLYPVAACANLNDLYVTVGKNRLYAAQGRASANALARTARALFERDAELSRRYNELDCGKWEHMMDQTHIGYTSWKDPPRNIMPAVAAVAPAAAAALGIAVEGNTGSWPPPAGLVQDEGEPSLPEIDGFDRKSRYIDVFNRGKAACSFSAASEAPWLTVSPDRGELGPDERLSVGVIWDQAPVGRTRTSVEIRGSDGTRVTVAVTVFNPAEPQRSSVRGFVETDGYVSIEAAHYGRAVASDGIGWRTIPDFGRTLSGVMSFPVTAPSASIQASFKPDAPRLEYRMYLFSSGTVNVELYAAPTMAFVPGRGLRCAVSFDGAPPKVVDLLADQSNAAWTKAVSDSIRILNVPERIDRPGPHVLKIWRVDPAFVLEKIVIDAGGVRPSYLGPPESFRGPAR